MELKELIKRFEGESLKPYPDTEGFMTIGVGWNMDANPLPDDIADYLKAHGEITQEMSNRLLDISIDESLINLEKVFNVNDSSYIDDVIPHCTAKRLQALKSVMFNTGLAGFKKFKKMIAAIKSGDWETASKELLNSKRTKQVGERAEIEAQMLREG